MHRLNYFLASRAILLSVVISIALNKAINGTPTTLRSVDTRYR